MSNKFKEMEKNYVLETTGNDGLKEFWLADSWKPAVSCPGNRHAHDFCYCFEPRYKRMKSKDLSYWHTLRFCAYFVKDISGLYVCVYCELARNDCLSSEEFVDILKESQFTVNTYVADLKEIYDQRVKFMTTMKPAK